MNVIEPTPSQAAVALKKFLASKGVNVQLGLAQEAYAATRGYASWNVLATDVPVRGEKKPARVVPAAGTSYPAAEGLQLWAITCRISGDDDDSLYMQWGVDGGAATEAAKVSLWLDSGNEEETLGDADQSEIYVITTERIGIIEGGVFKLESNLEPTGGDEPDVSVEPATDSAPARLPLEHFIDEGTLLLKDRVTDSDERLKALHDAIAEAADSSGLLRDWRRQLGRDEWCMEGTGPFVQVSYDIRLSPRFGTEIVLTLRSGEMAAYVRTWEFLDDCMPSSDYRIYDERSGDFDTNAPVPENDEPINRLIGNALREAHEHKEKLQVHFGVST